MSAPAEKSPEALAALLQGDGDPQQRPPPPYEPVPPSSPGDVKSGSKVTCASTTSLASSLPPTSIRPHTPSSCTKFFISQHGNKLRPWPLAHSSELVTPIFDASRTVELFTSTRFKKNSGTCVLTPVYDAEGQQQPVDLKDTFEVRTTYAWGPGNDPVISYEAGGSADPKIEVAVRSKGKLTRTRWFEWGGERYEWQYNHRRDGDGMVLQRLVSDGVCDAPEIIITDDKGPPTPPCSPDSKGKGKSNPEQTECTYVTVGEFMRDPEENRSCMGFRPAGQGGWVTIYDEEMKGGKLVLPHWLVLTTCMVMLKRERDRRAMQVAMMISGGGGGGP